MSEPVTLDDFMTRTGTQRLMTLADLIQVLEGMGAERKSFDREGIPNHWIEEGEYLVLRLDEA